MISILRREDLSMRGIAMRLSRLLNWGIAVLFVLCFSSILLCQEYLSWTQSQAKKIGSEMTEKGEVSGDSGWRVMSTNKATSYHFRATWLSPSVIKATARLEQFRQRLTNGETQNLVEEAEKAGATIFLVELDAVEGSGVIPPDWQAFLQPAQLPVGSDGCLKGQNTPELWKVKGLAGTNEKDYKYERFWMVFPLSLKNGQPLFGPGVEKAELIIRIHDKESKATFRIPADVFEKSRKLTQASTP
jgi:hypothetical protein